MSSGKGRGPLDLLSYVLLAGFVVVTLGPALIGRGTLFDVDLLTKFAPFSAIHGVDLNDTITCRTDIVNGYLPHISTIRSAFWSGDFPTWSPYVVGGVPLASLPNQAQLSPLTLPYYFLPLWLAPALVELGVFAVAIGGMFAFLRRHGVSRGASVIAGIIFASSGFMMMWTNWPQIRVACLIPALFWALERMVQQRRARDVVLLAVVVACMLLGGFPAVTMYALTIAGVYVVVRAVTCLRPSGRAIGGLLARAASGVVLGVGLAAIQILPFIRNLAELGLEERETAGLHLPLGLFVTTLAPDTVGLCVGGEAYGPVNPIEGVGFLGAAALVLVLCAFVWRLPEGTDSDRSPRVVLGVALGVVVLLIWVGGPALDALQTLPFFSSNSITRGQSVFAFLGAALAGVGLDRLLRWLSARRDQRDETVPEAGRARGMVPGAIILAAAAVFAGLVLVRGRADAHSDGYADHWFSALLGPALFLAAAVAAALITRFGPPRLRVLGPVALALLAVVQSAMFARTMLPLSDPDNIYPTTPTHAFLRRHLDGERFGASGATLYPSGAGFYKIRTPVGHEFTQPRWWDLLEAVDPDVRVSPTYSLFPTSLTAERSMDSRVLDQLAVRYWVGTSADVAGKVDPAPAATGTVSLRRAAMGHCEIRGGALRGVQVSVAQRRNVPTATPTVLHVRVRTPEAVLEGARLLGQRLPGGPVKVAVLGEDLTGSNPYPVEVWVTGARGLTRFEGTGDRLACAGVRPQPDGLRLAFAEAGDTVYERLSAMPRIRWASQSRVEPDAEARISDLKAGIPDDLVLLDDDSTPAAAGEPADVEVLSDRPERISARVRAPGDGYLVVADALVRDGWGATVDGKTVRLVHGNHAFGAVPVPAGDHQVELTYVAPGLAAGILISAGSGLVALGLLVWPWWARRRRVSGRDREQAIP